MNTDTTLHGIIPPLVTPLFNDNELDEEGLEKLINKLLKADSHKKNLPHYNGFTPLFARGKGKFYWCAAESKVITV